MATQLRIVVARLRAWLTRRRQDADFRDELRSHADLLADEYTRRGLTADEARRQAAVSLGSQTMLAQDRRHQLRVPGFEGVFRDLRFAVRLLGRHPLLTFIVALTMAVGIGVNTTVFSAFNAAALRPLPIAGADRAVRLERWFKRGELGNVQFLFSFPEYQDLRRLDTVTDLVAVSATIRVQPSASSADDRPFGVQLVSENFWSSLGAAAGIGRTPSASESGATGSAPVLVVSDAGWRRRFGADPSVVGRVLSLNGHAFTILGVAAPEFIGIGNPPVPPDFWAPLDQKQALVSGADWRADSRVFMFQLLGRLPAGRSLAAASARTAPAAVSLGSMFDDSPTSNLTLEPATFFAETNDPRFHQFVLLVMTVVGLVLASACANVANLLLARGSARQREVGMRLALGAARSRVVRQLLIESLLMSLFGGVLAMAAVAGVSHVLWLRVARAVQMVVGSSANLVIDLSPDRRVFAYSLLLSTAAGLGFGLMPALRLSRLDVVGALRAAGEHAASPRRSKLRGLLIGTQIAVSTMLALTAGLLTRGLARAQDASPGFDASAVYAVQYARDADASAAARIQHEVLLQLGEKTELSSVTLAEMVPFTGTHTRPVQSTNGGTATRVVSLLNAVSERYFDTIGIPLIAGRAFRPDEVAAGARVAVVSAGAARALWPGADPIGHSVGVPILFGGPLTQYAVIGVAGDVRSTNISRVDPAVVYMTPAPGRQYNVLVRSTADPTTVKAAVRSALAMSAPDAVRTLDVDRLDERFLPLQRILPDTIAAFARALALVALLLAATGVFGVVSFLANRRLREIGIRLALGATPGDATSLVVVEGLRPVLIGTAIGVGLATTISLLLRASLAAPGMPDFLFGMNAMDPVTVASVTAGAIAVAVIAALWPAWRAATIDPLQVIRRE